MWASECHPCSMDCPTVNIFWAAQSEFAGLQNREWEVV